MSKEKQILQYLGDGYSQRQTIAALGVSHNTVNACVVDAIRERSTPQSARTMDARTRTRYN